jgi:hypothetical protein
MSKFKKVAAGAGPPKPGFKANLPKFDSLASFMNFIKTNPEEEVAKFFTGENSKRNLNYLASMLMGWTTDRYTPSAFKHVLEMDEKRGYNNTKASQGAYEMMSPEIMQQLEDFKKNPPSNLTDFVTKEPVKSLENITVPETSDRYKAMEEKLYGKNASSQKFIKTSQAGTAQDLKKVMPEWTIETVLKDMANVAKNPRLSNAEKQKSMFDVLNNYERQIAPLSEYLRKNGIQPK